MNARYDTAPVGGTTEVANQTACTEILNAAGAPVKVLLAPGTAKAAPLDALRAAIIARACPPEVIDGTGECAQQYAARLMQKGGLSDGY